jgi:hypothetical protein
LRASSDGATYSYHIQSGVDWENGRGVYTASGTTLSRSQVLDSSNAGSLINLTGTSTVLPGLVLAQDLDDLRSPKLDLTATLYNGSTNARDIYAVHGLAILTDFDGDAIKTYDLTVTPAVLLSTTTYATMNQPRNIAVRWPYVYVTNMGVIAGPAGDSVLCFDASKPDAWTFVSETHSANLFCPLGIAASGNIIAVQDLYANAPSPTTGGRIVLFEANQHGVLREIGLWSAPSGATISKFQMTGGFIYACYATVSSAVFVVIDVRDPANPVTKSTTVMPAGVSPADVHYVDGNTFIANHGTGGGFVLVGGCNSVQPVVISQTSAPGGLNTTGVYAFGRYVAFGDLETDKVYFYDWGANPSAPVYITEIGGLVTPARLTGSTCGQVPARRMPGLRRRSSHDERGRPRCH